MADQNDPFADVSSYGGAVTTSVPGTGPAASTPSDPFADVSKYGGSVSDSSSTSSTPSSPSTFSAPSGQSYNVGQNVQHSSGATGKVTGQNPQTGKAEVKWYNTDAHGQPVKGDEDGKVHTIRANDPQGVSGKVARWAEQVQNDIRYGTDFTGIGGLLKKMGAHGVYTGNSQAVGDYLASIPLGLLSTVKGEAEMQNSLKNGTDPQGKQAGIKHGVSDLAGGVLQAAQIPASFVAPEATESALEAASPAVREALSSVGAKIGEGVDAVGSKVGDAVSGAKDLIGKAVEAPAKLANKVVPGVYPESKAAPTTQEVRDMVQGVHDKHVMDIRQTIGKAVEDEGLTMKPATSIQQVPVEATKAFDSEANKLYGQVDDAIEAATGKPGRYQEVDKNLNQWTKDLRKAHDPEEEANIKNKIAAARADQARNNEVFKSNPEVKAAAERATTIYKKARAMEDLGKGLQKHTSGLPAGEGDLPEQVNPKTFSNFLRNLQNNTKHGGSRLEQALGPEGAASLRRISNGAQKSLQQTVPDSVKASTQEAAEIAKQRQRVQDLIARGGLDMLGLGALHKVKSLFGGE